MDELVGILIALAATLLGLWGIGWAYGDFRKGSPTRASQPPGQTGTSTPPGAQGQKPT